MNARVLNVVFSTSWSKIHPVNELIEFVTADSGEHHTTRFIGITPIHGEGMEEATMDKVDVGISNHSESTLHLP